MQYNAQWHKLSVPVAVAMIAKAVNLKPSAPKCAVLNLRSLLTGTCSIVHDRTMYGGLVCEVEREPSNLFRTLLASSQVAS